MSRILSSFDGMHGTFSNVKKQLNAMMRIMFPNVNLMKYSRIDALKILIKRFSYRNVIFDVDMAKSFYKLPVKEIKTAIEALASEKILIESDGGYLLKADFDLLQSYSGEIPKAVYAMHQNDFLVKSNEHTLKEIYHHTYPDTLYYLLIDGEFCGAAVGKFRYTPDVEDIIADIRQEDVAARKDEILQAVHVLCGANNPIRRYQGEEI